ncbi:hypothetical protein Tco_1100018 [Tanacetum coccineum]
MQSNKDGNLVKKENSFNVLSDVYVGKKYVDVHAGDDSDSDVEIVYYEIGNFMDAKHLKSESGYGNKSLYERWKETLDDDDYDPYNDDEYNTHRLSEQQEAFCDALDIKFRDRKKVYVIFSVVLSQM